ncbi:hypothetical protein HanPI659440_Chr02g0089621 [Helianthus annuus]|nr:hypothetical protein HanPI659440_Chr02g0089621 [Helianthus annuus]
MLCNPKNLYITEPTSSSNGITKAPPIILLGLKRGNKSSMKAFPPLLQYATIKPRKFDVDIVNYQYRIHNFSSGN